MNDISEKQPTLFSAPRPAPSPPATPSPSHSPIPSPDSFHLTFTDKFYEFPHPPTIPAPSSSRSSDTCVGSESPTPSMSTSDTSTSPDSHSTGLPKTPSSSDDEFPSYYSSAWPSFNARRASIKPLVITKINPPAVAEDSDLSISLSLRQPFKNSEEQQGYTPSSSDDHSSSDESDSEWYTREFSKILTLCSRIPPSFPQQPRPESLYVPQTTAPPFTKGLVPAFPSPQLDPAFPSRRHSRSLSIPAYPPPAVPVIHTHVRTSSATTSPQTPPKLRRKSRSAALSLRRPPPRSSVPADCIFVDDDASYYAFSDDSASAFSFSMYDTLPTPCSPESMYSQPSPFPSSFPSTPSSFPESATSDEFEFDNVDIQFAMNASIDEDEDNQVMMLPSLPVSPIDLEADIASGLEELRRCAPTVVEDIFTVPSSPSSDTNTAVHEQQRVLRSKWSSSTLGSIREEHSRRSASAKLRAYFSSSTNSPSPKLRSSPSSRKLSIPTTPTTPPMKRSRHPRRELYTYTHTKKDLHSYSGTKPMNMVIMGYGQAQVQVQGVRRRRSVSASLSDAGSEDSESSSGSAGLRRKPIPVSMFLRSAV